jgi:predicted DNA-binding protein (MmcQ/YjbR family)
MGKLQSLKPLTAYLGAKPGAAPSYPFGPGALVFKVGEKMFALVADDERPLSMNLKSDPDEALALRAAHPKAITPAYHMNKRHWNGILLDSSLPDVLVREMIDQSYELVFHSLTKALQEKIAKKS